MINCYPVHGKAKSLDICEAFAAGCGGRVITTSWLPGPSMFFGVNDSNHYAWEQALLNQHRFDFYYADNSYFDLTRGTYFRVTKNRLQVDTVGEVSAGDRLPWGLRIQPWQSNPAGHIVICPQSDDFMRRIVGYRGDWLADIKRQLYFATNRRLVVREWNPNKAKLAGTLAADLEGAYCLVTWASAAAIEAVLAGVSVIVGSPQCAAWPFSNRVEDIHDLMPMPNPAAMPERNDWASVLADNQWTLEEIRRGKAFDWINRPRGTSEAQGVV